MHERKVYIFQIEIPAAAAAAVSTTIPNTMYHCRHNDHFSLCLCVCFFHFRFSSILHRYDCFRIPVARFLTCMDCTAAQTTKKIIKFVHSTITWPSEYILCTMLHRAEVIIMNCPYQSWGNTKKQHHSCEMHKTKALNINWNSFRCRVKKKRVQLI